jgi:hypothetical protein
MGLRSVIMLAYRAFRYERTPRKRLPENFILKMFCVFVCVSSVPMGFRRDGTSLRRTTHLLAVKT